MVLDNRGYGCINRLQRACGGAPFNNLLRAHAAPPPSTSPAHARRLGAVSEQVKSHRRAGGGARTRAGAPSAPRCVVIDTDPVATTPEGGAWWDVAVPAVSDATEEWETRARGYGRGATRASEPGG